VAVSWYRTGRLSLEHGSATVRGTATRWLSAAAPGALVLRDSLVIGEVSSVISDDAMVMAAPYAGISVEHVAYALITPVRILLPPQIENRIKSILNESTEVNGSYVSLFDSFVATESQII